ncbi:hypothetical protein [Sphingomonas ginsengisoli (ex An et al. 2013)]|uniref:hypothetical protein n=1 Tax=Sphingomonas ginsengisoli (ex An et al. 2013) TaxID=363835 RepID=UPI0013B3944F
MIVFWVHVAAELRSAAAPRTVLQAASASEPTIKPSATTVFTMIIPLLKKRNDHGPDHIALSTAFAAEFTSLAAPRTVLQAAIASELPIRAKVTTLRSMVNSPV